MVRGFLRKELFQNRSGKTTLMTIVLIIVALVVIVAIVIALTQFSNGSNQVKVVIDYSGNWSGSFGNFGSQNTYNGTGSQSFTIEQNSNTPLDVSATIQKSDGSSNTLTVSIENTDGAILASGNTAAAYGSVTVSWSNE